MPRLKVVDRLEMILRNIMALEQCHYPDNAHVCNYVLFLDNLIDTDKDVDLLVEKGNSFLEHVLNLYQSTYICIEWFVVVSDLKGIIKNWIGQPTSVAQMINKLWLGTIACGSYYYDIAVEVNKYYTNPVNRSKAILKRVYFCSLWTGTATIAATFLLGMTLIQTVASIIQVT